MVVVVVEDWEKRAARAPWVGKRPGIVFVSDSQWAGVQILEL